MARVAPLPIQPGTVIAGKYRTERLLGKGGMGAVVLARRIADGEALAIKFLLPTLQDDGHFVERFRREAKATARLSTAHVPRVVDMGTTELGAHYIVMEYCPGKDLRALVKESGPVLEHEAAAYVGQACVALAEAHALQIVHRDVKPSNLLLSKSADGNPLIKVLDFGVAKVRSANIETEMTSTGAVLGSRLYMAPEQMRNPRDVDPRADIWALGICLYYLVSGHTPFAAETSEEVVLAVVLHAPRALREVAPNVSTQFEEVVLKCLEKSRGARFPSVTELARALAPLSQPPAKSARSAKAAAAPPRSSPTAKIEPQISEMEPPASEGPTRLMVRAAAVEQPAPESTTNAWQGPTPLPKKEKAMSLATVAAGSVALGILVGLVALALLQGLSNSPTESLAQTNETASPAAPAPSVAAPLPPTSEPPPADVSPVSGPAAASAPPALPSSASPAPTSLAHPKASEPAVAPAAPSADSPW